MPPATDGNCSITTRYKASAIICHTASAWTRRRSHGIYIGSYDVWLLCIAGEVANATHWHGGIYVHARNLMVRFHASQLPHLLRHLRLFERLRTVLGADFTISHRLLCGRADIAATC